MPARTWKDSFLVHTTTFDAQNSPDLAVLSDGRFVVTWQDFSTGTSRIMAQVLNDDGTQYGSEFQIHASPDPTINPSIVALPDGNFAVSSTFVFSGDDTVILSVFDPDGNQIHTAITSSDANNLAQTDLATVDNRIWAAVSRDDDMSVISYIWNGAALSLQDGFIANNTAANVQRDGDMSQLAGGDIVVVWREIDTVELRVFNSSGDSLTLDRFVATTGAGAATNPEVMALANGGFVVTYTTRAGAFPADSFDVRAQIFTPNGTFFGAEIFINASSTLGSQVAVVTTPLNDGGFAAFWVDFADGAVIKGQLFGGLGDRRGSELTIDATQGGGTFRLNATTLQDGRIVVTWGDDNADESSSGILAAIIDPRDGIVVGTDGDEILRGSAFSDDMQGRDGDDTMHGMSGDDLMLGQAGNDVMYGDNGDDRMYSHAGNDIMNGGAGNDYFRGDAGADTIDGGSGVDWASYYYSSAGVNINLATSSTSGGQATGDTLFSIERLTGSRDFADVLLGDSADNHFRGYGGNDELRGFGGDDYFRGGLGGDTIDGGTGTDWASYYHSAAGVNINLTSGLVSEGDAAGDTLISIEKLSGSNAGNDDLRGTSGSQELRGYGGNDYFDGYDGADIIRGGAGVDWAGYYYSDAGVNINLTTGVVSGGYADGDILSSIERVTGSNGFNDSLYGNDQDNRLKGFGGNDYFVGYGGADDIQGGSGVDWVGYFSSLTGVNVNLSSAGPQSGGDAQGDILSSIERVTGSNNGADALTGTDGVNLLRGYGGDDFFFGLDGGDTLDGGAGSDTASYLGSDARVVINLATGSASGGHADGDTLISIENLQGSNGHDDDLRGDGGNNVLNGLGGNDYFVGGDGGDLINGGGGDGDWVGYYSSNAAVQIDLAGVVQTGGDAQGDQLFSIESVTGSNNFDDTLFGNSDDNLLRGYGGDDTLNGRAGSDELDGGLGDDTFVFDPNWGADVVRGFVVADDEILDFSSIAGIDEITDLTINYSATDTIITYMGQQITIEGSTATLQNDDFNFA